MRLARTGIHLRDWEAVTSLPGTCLDVFANASARVSWASVDRASLYESVAAELELRGAVVKPEGSRFGFDDRLTVRGEDGSAGLVLQLTGGCWSVAYDHTPHMTVKLVVLRSHGAEDIAEMIWQVLTGRLALNLAG
ncbi:MAG: hypothetical protein GEV03_28680 [Streptosporangiales bacterium]|nr:hypothetical protein [Streptosporangiales bacterium]